RVYGKAVDVNGNVGINSNVVVLDNWTRTIQTDATAYQANGLLTITGGAQYRANQSVNIYLVPAGSLAKPIDGGILSASNLLVTTTTDADGNLNGVATDLDNSPPAQGRYFLVADYIGDGVYHKFLDANKVITILGSTET